jgi:hypothetical protein
MAISGFASANSSANGGVRGTARERISAPW